MKDKSLIPDHPSYAVLYQLKGKTIKDYRLLNDPPADSRDHQSERVVFEFADGSMFTITAGSNLREWDNLRCPNDVKIDFILRLE